VLFALKNSIDHLIRIGKLMDVDTLVSNFFKSSNIPQSTIERVKEMAKRSLLEFRGEWAEFLGLYKPVVTRSRETGSWQDISWGNYYIARSILEMHHFISLGDLSELEELMKENIEIGWDVVIMRSYLLLSISSARQGDFTAAGEYMSQAEDHMDKTDNNGARDARACAKYELAFAKGNWREAVKQCKTMIEISKDCNYYWGWARRLIDLGDALVGRNEPGDLERARETYQQSLDMFTEMGASGYIKVLEERLARL
jgi:tetratricopeptide (TPR) repeat protein